MRCDLAVRFVEESPGGVTELCFHPATASSAELSRTMPDYLHAFELDTLRSPELRAALAAPGVRRVTFSDASWAP